VYDAPPATADPKTTPEDTAVGGNVLSNDPDPDNSDGIPGNEDTLTVSAVNGDTSAVRNEVATTHGKVTVNADGSYSYTPGSNFFGTDSFPPPTSSGATASHITRSTATARCRRP
jgi:hypothetical protein